MESVGKGLYLRIRTHLIGIGGQVEGLGGGEGCWRMVSHLTPSVKEWGLTTRSVRCWSFIAIAAMGIKQNIIVT